MAATVHVELVDASTGATFAEVDLSPSSLPASFEAQTTMHLGDQEWEVMSATPMASQEIVASGRLRLVLRRVQTVAIDPKALLFSLPTICDWLPAPVEGTTKLGKRVLELHEDEWGQIELFALANQGLVDQNLAAVRDVHETARRGVGFTRIHVRKGCDRLLEPGRYSLAELRTTCPAGSDWLDGVALQGLAGVLQGFAVRLPSGVALYGLGHGDAIRTLAIHSPGARFAPSVVECLVPFARAAHLGVVDWCRAMRFDLYGGSA